MKGEYKWSVGEEQERWKKLNITFQNALWHVFLL